MGFFIYVSLIPWVTLYWSNFFFYSDFIGLFFMFFFYADFVDQTKSMKKKMSTKSNLIGWINTQLF